MDKQGCQTELIISIVSSCVLHEVIQPTVIYNKGKQSRKKNSSTDSPISVRSVLRMWLLENHSKRAREGYRHHCTTGFSEELVNNRVSAPTACTPRRLIGGQALSAFKQLLQRNLLRIRT